MFRFKVANTVFHVITPDHIKTSVDSAYDDFICKDDHADILIETRYNATPDIELDPQKIVFDSQGSWKLYRINNKHIFTTTTPLLGPDPYRIAVFNDSYTQGIIYINIPEDLVQQRQELPDPLEFPLSENLMVSYLSKQRGVMFHACGIQDGTKGFLFSGNSTHGKSTTAQLWQNRAKILNDDRIIVRRENGVFKMYGTPWHGTFAGVAAASVQLHKLFFLRHAGENQLTKASGIKAASMLFTRCFPPFGDHKGIEFTLDFCTQLATSIPCYDFGFVPDESIVEFIRNSA